MKYPAVLGFETILPTLGEFDAIIDARSESEFALDHLPGAINCPVLDDAQRILVGTTYKQVGAFDAKKLGAPLVAKNIAHYIETLFADKPKEWKPLVYCWRGGNRSGSMALIFAKIGWPVVQLEGGYKAYRAVVAAALEQAPDLDLRVVCGTTGSGKTRLLHALEAVGAQVLDLEGLAAHRGSVLGHVPGEAQPAQKAFETALWDRLRRFDPARPVFVESESKKVGNLRVPGALMERMRAAPCIRVELARPLRVALLMEEYEHYVADPAALKVQLAHLAQLHGNAKIAAWDALADAGRIGELVEQLLAEHYDPAYLKSIDRNFVRYPDAEVVELAGIDDADFTAAAHALRG
jgi:tRNA 2-selenouridine synthase